MCSTFNFWFAPYQPLSNPALFSLHQQRLSWTGKVKCNQNIDCSVFNDVNLACNPRSVLLTNGLFQGFTLLPEWCVYELNVERKCLPTRHRSWPLSNVKKKNLTLKRWLNEMHNVPLSAQCEANILSLSSQTHWQPAAWIFSPPSQACGALSLSCSTIHECELSKNKKKQKKKAIFCTWHQVDTATECIQKKLKVCCASQYCSEHYGWWSYVFGRVG